MKHFIIVLFLVFCSAVALAAPNVKKSYYDDSRRGWWWYEEEPVKSKDTKSKDKNEKQEDNKETKPARILPSLKDYTAEQLWNMHPDDFQPLTKDFLKKAVQTPTIENVRDFYVMVDIARMKSHVFQNVAGAAWQKYPELSMNADLPAATFGRVAQLKMAMNETKSKIKASEQDFALIYFYADGCEFCKAQEGALDAFVQKYDWEVKRVEIRDHPELAARFDIKITPYIILIYRESKEYFPVSIGVSSLDEIEDRIYRGMRLLSGEVSPESYTMYDFQRGGRMDPSGYMNNAADDNQ